LYSPCTVTANVCSDPQLLKNIHDKFFAVKLLLSERAGGEIKKGIIMVENNPVIPFIKTLHETFY
jgi:hypothetical protein